MKTLKGIENLVVDANPLISAIIGGQARYIFLNADNTSFFTTSFNFREVEKYIPVLSDKRGIKIEHLYMALSMLPVTVYDEDYYRVKIRKAKKLIAHKDPDDFHLLALSLKLGFPLWSNDKDFEGLDVKVFRTLELLKKIR